jgi:hypothetical protein
MASIVNQNVSGQVAKEQAAKERECQLSGEQEAHRKREVQNIAQQLRLFLIEGKTPNTQALSDLLLKAEELLSKSAQRPDIDPETRKTFEDISSLLVTAKQMERNKGIADRLQKIADESQKAVEAMRRAGGPLEARKATEEAVNFVNTWRPVFQLLIRSRDFRQLIVDLLSVVKKIVSRQSDVVENVQQKFVEGASGKEMFDTAKQDLKEKKDTQQQQMTDQEWEALLDQFQRVLVVLAREPTYREGINRLFSLFDMFRNTSQNLPGGIQAETHARRAKQETEDLLASFAGKENLEQFKYHLRKLIDMFNNNPEWNQYLNDLKDLILSSKSEEEVKSEQFKQRSKNIANRGRELMQRLKDENEVDDFFRSASLLLDNIKNDEFMKLLSEQAGIIRADLSYVDTTGKVQVDTDMLSKLQSVLLPVLAESLKYIPIPRIESHDSKREFWLDNITLCGYDVIPENIHFHLESDSDVSLKDIETKSSHTHLVIRLDRFRTELKNLKFWYKKKTFPELTDSGVVTIRIGGDGARLNIVFTVDQNREDNRPRLTEGYADFHIRHMDIEFDKSTLKHDVLVPMMTTLFKQQIQSQIEKIVEHNLTSAIQKLGEQLTQTLSEVNRPFLGGLETARKALKQSEMAQVYGNRREKLE